MSSGSNPLKRLRVFEPGELLETAEAVANKDSLAGVRLVLEQGAIFSLPVNEESSRARLVPTSGSTVVGAEETMAKQLVLNKKIIEKKILVIYTGTRGASDIKGSFAILNWNILLISFQIIAGLFIRFDFSSCCILFGF